MFLKGLERGLDEVEIGGRIATTQTTELLKSAEIPRRARETKGDLMSLRAKWKTIS